MLARAAARPASIADMSPSGLAAIAELTQSSWAATRCTLLRRPPVLRFRLEALCWMLPELGTALFSWLATVGSTGFGSPGPSATGVDGVATGATRLRESPTRPSRFDDPGLDATCQAAVLGPAMDTIARSRGSAGKPDPLIGMKRGPAPAGASRGSNRICLPPPLDEVRDSRRARARPWCDAVARTRTLEASGDSIPGRTKEGGRLSRRAPGWCRSARPGEPEA